jgi:CRP/FNR family cyclic AMP-dependent transcriptional regulator
MLTQDPELALELLQLAARRMRCLTNQIQQQSLNPLPQRLAQKILHLLCFDKKQSLGMSQADLADFLGATREAVSRILTTWKKSGILDLRRGQIAILDRSAFERIAHPEKMSEV